MTYQMKLDEMLEEGIAIGVRENKLDTARKAVERGFAPDVVAELTGLSLEEVKALL